MSEVAQCPARVVLIGFQDQGNLGLGYLAAVLRKQGCRVSVLDCRQSSDALLAQVLAASPVLVGFSIIFQFHLRQFAALASSLRRGGVVCHFCAGGHFPSLRSEVVLRIIPELDSVVRGEGELTLAELVQCIGQGCDWRALNGLAYRVGNACKYTPPRPLIADLNALPWPAREWSPLTILGRRVAPISASRGCGRNCSFCSIREFYRLIPGRKVRVRTPAGVVEEMLALHRSDRISVFLFQDDDFPVGGAFGRRWSREFAELLHQTNLAESVIWKISCRADQVEKQHFALLREAGLYLVYVGFESGNEIGLRTLNKGLGLADNVRAAQILKKLELGLSYGFMMFDPSSSFASLKANVRFLRRMTTGGSAVVGFCRMMPYAGTPIESTLSHEGRLGGDTTNPDYTFLDPRIDALFQHFWPVMNEWMGGTASPLCAINWAWQEYRVMQRLHRPLPDLHVYRTALERLTQRANEQFLTMFESCCRGFETSTNGDSELRGEPGSASDYFVNQVRTLRDRYIAEQQQALLAAC